MLGLEIPIFTQVIGFVYLAIIPGILVLRIFRFNELPVVEIYLYSIGFSITFLMFFGALMNVLLFKSGISKPISSIYMIVIISFFVLLLCVVNYLRDKEYSYYKSHNFKFPLISYFYFSFIVLSILGTYLMNFYNNNLFLLLLLIIISLIPIFFSFGIIKNELYSLVIFLISISLLYHRSLISNYLWGWDIHEEYYFLNIVKTNSIWDITIPNSINAMLSISILGTTFSNICNINLIYTLKIIYPLLFSLVPLGLYQIFKKQTNDQIAFISCFYFMSVFQFYTGTLWQVRTQVAELFLILIILLIVRKNIETRKRIFMLTIFSFSLTVSHYGLCTVYLLSLIFVWVILFIINKTKIVFLKNCIENKILSLNYIILFIIFTVFWFRYISSGVIFNQLVTMGVKYQRNLFPEFLNPEVSQGLEILITKYEPLQEAKKVLHLICQFFSVVGLLSLFLKNKNTKFIKEYVLFSIAYFGFFFACIIIPYFARSMNTVRFFQFSLIFLAPFCIIGGIKVIELLSKVFRMKWSNESLKNALKILSIFFTVFLLFNSGFINEVAKVPTSISLNNNIDWPRFNNKEIYGASWITDKTEISPLYGDTIGYLALMDYALWRVNVFDNETEKLSHNSYVYFRSLNVEGKIPESFENYRNYIPLKEYKLYNKIIIKMNKIYDNGGSHIYH